MASGEILVAHGMWEVIRSSRQFVPHSVGVYGASMTGKTTLDKQLTTHGEVRPLGDDERTHHKKKRKGYVLPEATAKRIRSHGLKRTVVSRDMGGHVEYQSSWLKDMWQRKVKTIAYELWEKGFIVRHSIFDAFRQTLYEFQEANIPVRVDACAASIGWNVDDAIFKGLMDL